MKNKELINWSNLSRYLTGEPYTVKSNRMSQKNAKKVKLLDEKIQEWKESLTVSDSRTHSQNENK